MNVMEKLLESDDGNGDAFTPIADLMSGLMIIFLFIALLYMRDIPLCHNRSRLNRGVKEV